MKKIAVTALMGGAIVGSLLGAGAANADVYYKKLRRRARSWRGTALRG